MNELAQFLLIVSVLLLISVVAMGQQKHRKID